jgi:hypothetical protein
VAVRSVCTRARAGGAGCVRPMRTGGGGRRRRYDSARHAAPVGGARRWACESPRAALYPTSLNLPPPPPPLSRAPTQRAVNLDEPGKKTALLERLLEEGDEAECVRFEGVINSIHVIPGFGEVQVCGKKLSMIIKWANEEVMQLTGVREKRWVTATIGATVSYVVGYRLRTPVKVSGIESYISEGEYALARMQAALQQGRRSSLSRVLCVVTANQPYPGLLPRFPSLLVSSRHSDCSLPRRRRAREVRVPQAAGAQPVRHDDVRPAAGRHGAGGQARHAARVLQRVWRHRLAAGQPGGDRG